MATAPDHNVPARLSYVVKNELWKTIKLSYPSPPLIVFTPQEIYQFRGRAREKWEKGLPDELGGIIVEAVGVGGITDQSHDRRARMSRLSLVTQAHPGAEPIFDVSFGTLLSLPNIAIGLKRLANPSSAFYPLHVIVLPPQIQPMPGENPEPAVKVGIAITGFYNSRPSGMPENA